MKNSLFKRAMAVASAVPLALTQCLGVANAVDVTDAAPAAGLTGATATLNDGSEGALFYIEPDEKNEKYTMSENEGNYTFTKDSVWYSDVYNILAQIGNGTKNSGTIDATTLFDYALNRAGQYRDLAEGVVNCIGEMKYTVDASGNVTITGNMENVVPVFEQMGRDMVGDSLKNLADQYDKYNIPNLEDLKNFEFFGDLEIAGNIEIAVSSSSLKDGTSTSAVITFTDKVTGAQYKGTAILDYVKAQLETIETTATTTIDALVEEFDLTDEEFEEMVQNSEEFDNLVNNLMDGYTPEDGEIEAMILESVEFKNLVADYMEEHGIDYAEAEEKIKESDKYKDLIDRFTNGLNLDDETIKSILDESPEYEQLVNEYMDANEVTYDEAVDAVLQSEDYQKLLTEFTDKYTYTREEVAEIVKGTDSYKDKVAKLKEEYKGHYANMSDKAASIKDYVQNIATFFSGKLDTADKYIGKALNYSGSKSADSITPIIEAVNKRIPAVTTKVEKVSKKAANKIDGKQLPTSGAEIAANEMVQKIYNEVINQILASSPVAVDIDAADWGELADSFSAITASADKGVATLKAQLPDEEAAAATAFIEGEYDVDVTEIFKEIEIEVDFSAIETEGAVSYDMNLKRVVKATEKEKESSSTTDTSTTASTDTGTTPTETTPSDTNTSETGTTPTETTPTDTNTSETGTTPTETTPTDTNTSDTGTTPTDTTPSDTNTSSTGTETTGSADPSTTTAVVERVVNFKTETEVGFYLDVDKEFNKEQIKSISYSVDLSTVYYDADGNVVGQRVDEPGEQVDILNAVEFKDVPADVLADINKNGVASFASQIPVYAKEAITAADGTVVANAGDVLKNIDGSKISVTAYIGVKGDADLDMTADSSDASKILTWYGKMQTGGDAATTQFCSNDILVQSDPMLDELAAFLCDVDNENDSQNWKLRKPERTIAADDASFILGYYGKVMTGSVAGRDTWNGALGVYAKQ